MPRLMGSKLVTCRNKHNNFILPGVARQCSTQGCKCAVKLEKEKLPRKSVAAKVAKKPAPAKKKARKKS